MTPEPRPGPRRHSPSEGARAPDSRLGPEAGAEPFARGTGPCGTAAPASSNQPPKRHPGQLHGWLPAQRAPGHRPDSLHAAPADSAAALPMPNPRLRLCVCVCCWPLQGPGLLAPPGSGGCARAAAHPAGGSIPAPVRKQQGASCGPAVTKALCMPSKSQRERQTSEQKILIKCDKCHAVWAAGGAVGASGAPGRAVAGAGSALRPPVALGAPSGTRPFPLAQGARRRHGGPQVWSKHVYCGKGWGAAHQAKSGLPSSLESSHRQLSSSRESPRNLGGTTSMASLRSAAGLPCRAPARRSGRFCRMP